LNYSVQGRANLAIRISAIKKDEYLNLIFINTAWDEMTVDGFIPPFLVSLYQIIKKLQL